MLYLSPEYMTGVYNDFMEKYNTIIKQASEDSDTIQTKYLN